jgi:hypothetical protein
MTDDRQSQIDTTIEKFNFHKVLVAMQALDWKWVNSHDKKGISTSKSVPTIVRLKSVAEKLLSESINSKIVCSGGLEARYYPSVDGDPEWFELRFVLEESDSLEDY